MSSKTTICHCSLSEREMIDHIVDTYAATTRFGPRFGVDTTRLVKVDLRNGVLRVAVIFLSGKLSLVHTRITFMDEEPSSQLGPAIPKEVLRQMRLEIPDFQLQSLVSQQLTAYARKLPWMYTECYELPVGIEEWFSPFDEWLEQHTVRTH